MIKETEDAPKLKRSLNLTLLVFYGLGTTIGAGIYVLVGAAAGHAGIYAPIAFIAAAIGIAPTTMSFAELSGRMPVSAGEAAYVRAGYRSRSISMLTGWMVILSGIVASATIAIGCAGYLREFLDIPSTVLIVAVVLIMGLVAIWGIMESVFLAAIFTLIEAGGLIVLIVMGFSSDLVDFNQLPEMIPPLNDSIVWLGIFNAGILAVFAFIGFEDMVNVAEETIRPHKTMPRAIFLTLFITAVLYALVAIVSVLAVEPLELSKSEAPLSLVFQKLSGFSPLVLSAIAVFATANTILIQIIMASRVAYGMAKQKTFPKIFSSVNRKTKTPILATLLVTAIILSLALFFNLERLATITSQLMLVIWTLVNVALILIKVRKDPIPEEGYKAPFWVPVFGAIFCGALVLISIFT